MAVGSGLFPFTELQVQFQSALCLVLKCFPDHWVHARFHGSWKKHFFSKSKCSHYFFLGYVVPKSAKVLFQRLMYGSCYKSHVCLLFHADDNMLHGPVFLQEPSSVIFPLDSEEKKVKLNCEVKGNPRPTIGFVAFFPVPLHSPYSGVPSSPPHLSPHLSTAAPTGGSLSVDTKEKHTLGSPCIATRL